MDEFEFECWEDTRPDYDIYEENQVFLDNEGCDNDEFEEQDDVGAEEQQRIDAERDEPWHDEPPEHDDPMEFETDNHSDIDF
jgi:hypothetical protein